MNLIHNSGRFKNIHIKRKKNLQSNKPPKLIKINQNSNQQTTEPSESEIGASNDNSTDNDESKNEEEHTPDENNSNEEELTPIEKINGLYGLEPGEHKTAGTLIEENKMDENNSNEEELTPIEKINGLYGLDDGHYTSAIRELIEESKRDEELKKYLFAYLCDNYGFVVDVYDKNIVLTNKKNETLDLNYIYNKLVQLNFITNTTDDAVKNEKSYRDWFKIYSCGPNRNILNELNDKVEEIEILEYFKGIGLTLQINDLEHARKLKEIVKDILFYVAELRMTNFEYVGFNINVYELNTLHNALKVMYEIEHRIFAKLMWNRTVYSVVDVLIYNYFVCMDWILYKGELKINENFKHAITSSLELNYPEQKDGYPDINNISDFQTAINKFLKP